MTDLEERDRSAARLEAAKEGLRSSAARTAALWAGVLQQAEQHTAIPTNTTPTEAWAMQEIHTFRLPAGTAISGEDIGATLRADAVVVCHPRDEYLIRAALKLLDDDQRLSTSTSHSSALASKPCQAAAFPVMSTTNSSSLESKCCATQSRTCTAVSDVSTIQVVVSLDQRVGNVEIIASRN